MVDLLISLFAGVLLNSGVYACEPYTITGYVRGADSPWTADGTSVWTREDIAAGSYNLPFDTIVQVQFPWGPAEYRIADRGRLNVRHIDILLDTRSEAFAITSTRIVCIVG